MPVVVDSPTRLAPDAFQMPKADDDFHLGVSGGSWSRRPRLTGADLWILISISCVKLKAWLIYERFNAGWTLASSASRESFFLPRSRSHPRPRKRVEVFPALTASLRLRKPVSTQSNLSIAHVHLLCSRACRLTRLSNRDSDGSRRAVRCLRWQKPRNRQQIPSFSPSSELATVDATSFKATFTRSFIGEIPPFVARFKIVPHKNSRFTNAERTRAPENYYRSSVRNIPSIRCANFVVSGNKFLWLPVFLVMLGLSDYARSFFHAVDKEKTSRKRAVTRNETTVDQTVVSADAIQPGMNDRSRSARFESQMLPFMSEAYNLARWIMKDESDARDATQDAYLRAFRYFESFHGDSGRAWLLRIVRNVCYDALRARDLNCNIISIDEGMVAAAADPKPAPNVIAIREATKLRVREAIEALPLEFRTVIILRELEGFSYKEISGIVGVPIGTVMSRLSRARQQLATLLQEEGENE
jgi:RNA polymerase sigma factor (sigma-70 family)